VQSANNNAALAANSAKPKAKNTNIALMAIPSAGVPLEY